MANDLTDEFGARLWGGQTGFSTRIAILFALALLGGAAYFGWNEWRVRCSLDWPSTLATVISHSSARGNGGSRGSPRYQTVVFYDFTVDGVLRRGSRLAFHVPVEFDEKLSHHAAVSAGMNRFPMGSSFPVFYDPNAPGESILLRTRENWIAAGTLGAFAGGAAALALWLALQDRKAAAKRYPRLWPLPGKTPLVPSSPKGKPRRTGRQKP
ncbi:MAG: DUF3592 domain-containing protein [Planctomycetota bacterium]